MQQRLIQCRLLQWVNLPELSQTTSSFLLSPAACWYQPLSTRPLVIINLPSSVSIVLLIWSSWLLLSSSSSVHICSPMIIIIMLIAIISLITIIIMTIIVIDYHHDQSSWPLYVIIYYHVFSLSEGSHGRNYLQLGRSRHLRGTNWAMRTGWFNTMTLAIESDTWRRGTCCSVQNGGARRVADYGVSVFLSYIRLSINPNMHVCIFCVYRYREEEIERERYYCVCIHNCMYVTTYVCPYGVKSCTQNWNILIPIN